MSSPRHRFGNGSWTHDFVKNTGKCPPPFSPSYFPRFFNQESAQMNTNKNAGRRGRLHQLSAISPQPLHHAVAAQRAGGSLLYVRHTPSVLSPQSSVLSPQSSVLSHQSSAISHQPSAISHQPSAISHQLSAIRYQPSVLHNQSSITSSRRSRAARRRIASPCLPFHHQCSAISPSYL